MVFHMMSADGVGELTYEGFMECEQIIEVQGDVGSSERAKSNALNWLTCFDAPRDGHAYQSDGDRVCTIHLHGSI